jgi:hypothetical protein
MSHYLSQLEGSERAQECIRHDKEMNAHLPDPIRLALAPFAPAYLEGQARRARELVDLLHEQELNRLREAGGL